MMAPRATQVSISVMLAVRAVSSTMQWTAWVEDIFGVLEWRVLFVNEGLFVHVVGARML